MLTKTALLLSLASSTALAAGPPTLGAHTLLWQENQVGTNPAVTAPLATQASGSSFVVVVAGFVSNVAAPTDNKGNAWPMLGAPAVYLGYGGTFDARAYLAVNGHGGAGHTVTLAKTGYPEGEVTAPFVEIRDADVLQAVAQNYPSSGAQITSGSVTTTGPAVLLAIWLGDNAGLSHSAVPGNGFTVIDSILILPPLSAVQCAVAVKQVATAGTYDVTWTQSPSQGAILWLYAFQSSSAADAVFASGFE